MAPKRNPKRGAADDTASAGKKGKTGLAIGDMIPEFEVETDDSSKITSKELVAESGAIIFFYPRANTGGCTTQACGFRDHYEKLVASGYKVFGMSADKPKSQASWKAKYNFQYPLLCDPTHEVLKVLGVSKGGSSVRRSHLVIAKGGKLEHVEYDISPKNSVAKAVELIKETLDAEAPAADIAPAAASAEEAPAAEAASAAAPAAGEPSVEAAPATAPAEEAPKEEAPAKEAAGVAAAEDAEAAAAAEGGEEAAAAGAGGEDVAE